MLLPGRLVVASMVSAGVVRLKDDLLQPLFREEIDELSGLPAVSLSGRHVGGASTRGVGTV
ncbi:MAG: hypothetical protein OXQ84_21215 [bacterium]|nr:hypothetical protein [bacterium]